MPGAVVYVPQGLEPVMKICVLLPAYNESRAVFRLVRDIKGIVPDVIVVDDGSSDDTAGEAGRAGAVVLRNEKNMGKGASLRKGFEHVAGGDCDAVITMDADGQHDYREIPLFIDKMLETNADIVIGTRMGETADMPLIRLLTNRVTSLVVSLLCLCRITDSQSGYRLIKKRVLKEVSLETSNYDTESEILIKAARKGFSVKEVPVRTIYGGQESKIRPGKDTVRFIKLVFKSVFCYGKKR